MSIAGKKKMIEALTPKAAQFATYLKEYHTYPNYFHDWDNKFSLIHGSDTSDRLWFKIHDNAIIEFHSFRPMIADCDLKVYPPQIIGEEMKNANSISITNQSDCEIERTYTVSESTTKSVNVDVGVEVGLEVRQQFTYEGLGVEGETEITASVNASWNRSEGTEDAMSTEASNTITVPPWTKVDIARTESVSKYKQDIVYTAPVDFGILLYSGHHFKVEFDSLGQFLEFTDGITKIHNHQWDFNWLRQHPISKYSKFKSISEYPVVRIEKQLTVDQATTGGISVTQTKLK